MQVPTKLQDTSPTRTATILDTLRDEILEVRLRPGDRLRFDTLRKHYDIGISPLREALMQLASEGLVVSELRKGYRVAPVSDADLREVARLRGEFDSIAISESMRHGDEVWEGRILAAFHALSRRSKLGPDDSVDPLWERAHIKFHTELVSECRMPKLMAFREILDLQALRYRRVAAVIYLKAGRDDLAEHKAIMEAVLDRDAQKAGQLIRDHYFQTVRVILSDPDSLDV